MKRAARVLVLAAAGLLVASLGGASEPPVEPYRPAARVAHIEGALTAVRETPPAALQQAVDYARTLSRGACSAGVERLRIECLMVEARRYCHDRAGADAQRCPASMDIVVSNVLADERLIPLERRYQIVREDADYRAALARELRRIQGALAVDFRLRAGEADDDRALAAKIDAYCLDSADQTNLPYPICVSSLVWFIRGPQ